MNRFLSPAPSSVYGAETTGGTVAGVWEIDKLVEGSIAVFNEAGTLLASTARITDSYPTVNIVRSMGATKSPIVIPSVDTKTLRVKKTAYKAPAKMKIALGQYGSSVDSAVSLNLPDLIANGDSCSVMLVDLDKPLEDISRYTIYQIDVLDSDVLTGTGTNNILYRLIANINADSTKVATATAVSADATNIDGILFESVSVGGNFAVVKMEGILELATISSYKNKAGVFTSGFTTLPAVNKGIGTYAQMLLLEKESESILGRNDLRNNSTAYWTESSQLTAGTTYTQYELSWENQLSDVLIRTNGFKDHAIIAVKSTDATLIGILDVLFTGIITTTADLY